MTLPIPRDFALKVPEDLPRAREGVKAAYFYVLDNPLLSQLYSRYAREDQEAVVFKENRQDDGGVGVQLSAWRWWLTAAAAAVGAVTQPSASECPWAPWLAPPVLTP